MLTDWQAFAVASAFFAGLTAVLAKIGVANIPSNSATLIRTIVILIFLSALVFARHEWINPLALDRKSLLFLVLSGVAAGLSWICYFRALQMGPASIVSPLDKLSLPFAVLLSVLFLGDRLNVQQWGGVILMSVGALLIAFK